MKITVTGTATPLYTLMDTAGSTSNNESYYTQKGANMIIIRPENYPIRVLFGDDPTTSIGTYLSEGVQYYLPGADLSQMRIIRATGSNASVSLDIGIALNGESYGAVADSVTLEGGTITIGKADQGTAGTSPWLVTENAPAMQAMGSDSTGQDTFSTVKTPSADAKHIIVTLSGVNPAVISLDNGSTDHFWVPGATTIAIDNVAITSGVAIKAKNGTPGSNYSGLKVSIW